MKYGSPLIESDDIIEEILPEETVESVVEEIVEQVVEPVTEKSTDNKANTTKSTTSNLLSKITKKSSTEDRIKAVMQYLISEGFSTEAAAGVVGNMAVESCFNPSTVTKAGYYGLFQWNTSAAGGYWWNASDGIEKWLTKNGYTWNSFEGQVKALLGCPRRGHLSDSRLKELKKLKNVEQSTELFCIFYEGCVGGSGISKYYNKGEKYQALDTRKSEAWMAYYLYNGTHQNYKGVKKYIES